MQGWQSIAHTTDHLTTSTVNRSQTLPPSPSVIFTAYNINSNRLLVVSHYHDHHHDELYIMSTSTSTRSNSTTVPVHTRPIACKIDPDILNENSLQDMNDIGLSFFASVCGKNRGAFVLDPPDGNTYGWYVYVLPTSLFFIFVVVCLYVCLFVLLSYCTRNFLFLILLLFFDSFFYK